MNTVTPQAAGSAGRRAALTARTAFELVAFLVIHRVCRFATLRAWVAAYPVARRRHDADLVSIVTRAVDRASVYSPCSLRCLARAVIATRLLRSHGFAATMVTGVHRMPFNAHAWVEIDDEPIYGLSDPYHCYRVIDRV